MAINEIVNENCLSAKQARAIVCLIAGWNEESIVSKILVTPSELREWKKQENFKKAFRQALSATFEEGLAELVLGIKAATQELNRIIADDEERTSVKLSAINILLNHGGKFRDFSVGDRLDELEAKLDAILQIG